jgi:hypothetical protein
MNITTFGNTKQHTRERFFMKSRSKPARSIRPRGRNPVISGRVSGSLYQRIQEAAQASGRSMSEELAARTEWALRLVGSGDSGRAIELAALAFLFAGERKGQERGVPDWTKDLAARRDAVLAACVSLITQFLSDDAEEQHTCVQLIQNRIYSRILSDQLQRKMREQGGER